MKTENWEKTKVRTEVEDDKPIWRRRAVIDAALRAPASGALKHLLHWHYWSCESTAFCNIADTFIYIFSFTLFDFLAQEIVRTQKFQSFFFVFLLRPFAYKISYFESQLKTLFYFLDGSMVFAS